MPNAWHHSNRNILIPQTRPRILVQLFPHNDRVQLTQHQPHVPDTANALLHVRPQHAPPLVLVVNRRIANRRDEGPDEARMRADLPIDDGADGARWAAV
jgi:hypothetical protein